MKRGFTMVELLVAMSLFVILVSISSGVFIKSMRTQRATAALMAANSNASLAIEQIAKEIRTGETFSIDADSGGLIFINAKGEKVKYELGDSSLMRSVNDGEPLALTAGNVNVKNLSFYLSGEQPGDKYNPKITLVLQVGATGIPFSDAVANLQTTISPRTLQD